MSTNKNAQLRYQILDRCFSDFTHRYTIDDLIDKVNETLYDMFGTEVSLRQIRADIQYMRDRESFNAPIKAYIYDGKKRYYRYDDPNYSIFNNELSVDEVSELRKALNMLSRYRGIEANGWLDDAIAHMETRFGLKPNTKKLVSFDDNEDVKGGEFLSELIDKVTSRQPLTLDYKTFKGDEFTTVVHPYYLKQYNSRWFLIGYDDVKNRIQNYALDRIVSFRDKEIKFKPTDIDFEDYFKDVIGVTVPEDKPIEHVVLRFTDQRFPYVLSKKLHHSQKLCEEPCTISIDVKLNRELTQQIFSFGPDVEVIAPECLRQAVKEKIEDSLKKYSTVKQ